MSSRQLITALAEQGIQVTEGELAEMVSRARRARTLLVEVPWSIYAKWEEIQRCAEAGEIDKELAAARFEQEVFPHLGLRPGVDYDPRADTIDIIPRRTVRSVLHP